MHAGIVYHKISGPEVAPERPGGQAKQSKVKVKKILGSDFISLTSLPESGLNKCKNYNILGYSVKQEVKPRTCA